MVVGIRDVAAHAGVSMMSVSRVINNKPRVDQAIRQRVLQAMAELNYTPNSSARSLRLGQTELLGVLLPDTDNPLYGRHVNGIRDTAYDAGYGVFVYRAGHNSGEDARYIQLLQRQRVAGFIVTSPGWNPYMRALEEAGVTGVCIDHRAPGYDWVTVDNVAATMQAVDHLARLGHRKIAMLTGPMAALSERQRLVGYRRAMRRLGLPLGRHLQGVAAGFADHDAMDVVGRMVEVEDMDRPTALVVSSSDLTPGALVAATAAGLRIPEDLALVSFGDLSWTPTLVSPITSLVEPAYDMGAEACRLLLDRLTGRYTGVPRQRNYPTRLVVRLSCGAPAEDRDSSISPATLLFHGVALADGHDRTTIETDAHAATGLTARDAT